MPSQFGKKILRSLVLLGCLTSGARAAQLYSHGDPTDAEQFMLELINRGRMDPSAEADRFGIDLNEGIAPGFITPTPKQPLAFNRGLIDAARGHSTWMLDNDIFAHFETSGSDPGDRMTTSGYVFSGSYTWGENIAWRGSSGNLPPLGPTVAQEHADLFVDMGIEGRGHRVNLMHPDFREIGIGVSTGIFDLDGTGYESVMVTQDFAASGANPGPFLVGVVFRDVNGDGTYSIGEGVSDVTVTLAGGQFETVTSSSGGYAVPITGLKGLLNVTFSDGPLDGPFTKSLVLNGGNEKLDFELNIDAVPKLGFVPGSMKFSKPSRFEADLRGPANALVSVQASEDLTSWTEIAQVSLTQAGFHFSDKSANTRVRYYRAVQL